MSAPLQIALIGFGEVGVVLADDLIAQGAALQAYDTKFVDTASAASHARAARPVGLSEASAACSGAGFVISAVTAAQTEAAAANAALSIAPGAFYLDLNSASPNAKRAAARAINDAGGRYVEAAVMSPIGPKRSASPMLLGGPHAEDFLHVARDLGFAGARVFSPDYGQASAAKLCRSVMVKGIEALLSESLLSARRYGVEETVLASLDDLFPGLDWPALSRYMISRTIEHGARRAEEMIEAARTVAEAGVAPLMSEAIARRQQSAPAFQPALRETELAALLDAVIAQMDGPKP